MARYQTYKLTEGEKVQYESLLNDEEIKSFPKEVIRILFNRGIRTKDEIMLTLFGKLDNLYNVPMRDAKVFNKRLEIAFVNKEQVVIMGDYDTDGCMATSVMVLGLRALGFKVGYYMNSRFKDGYGLKEASVDVIREKYPDVKVIITVDNGIRAFSPIDYCNDLGIDVLVTDHHNPKDVLPNALAVIDPKRTDCMYPFKGLCGAGVAWKLMIGLCNHLYPTDVIKRLMIKDLMWLVGIATVGDQVPLVNENRIIVKEVLRKFNDPSYLLKNIFIKRIKESLNINCFDSDTIAFYISPMINAMGRIEGNPLQIVDAIVSNDINIIDAIVQKMEEINKVRREQTSVQFDIALNQLEDEGFMTSKEKGILVCSDEFTEGIIGIVASRLTEKFNVPSAVLAPNEDGSYKGSCRSIEGINIEGVLSELSYYLVNFGGHDMAAGLTISKDAIPVFKERFIETLSEYDDSIFEDVVMIDLAIREDGVTASLCTLVDELGPYGNSFRKPRFFLKDFNVDKLRSIKNKSNSFYVGKEGKTLRLVNPSGLVSIGFQSAEKYKMLEEPEVVSLVGYPSLNEYNGNFYPQFQIEKTYLLKSK